MKVQFVILHTGIEQPRYSGPVISLVPYQLRSFYKKTGQHYKDYVWLPNESGFDPSKKGNEIKNAFNVIKERKPDVVCLTLYVWNSSNSIRLAKKIKEILPNCIIMAGGPEVEHALGTEYAKKNPYFDYICYGDGEETFQMLLDSFITPINEQTIPNLITKEFKTDHKIYRFKDHPSYNPYLDLKQDLLQEYEVAEKNRADWLEAKGLDVKQSDNDSDSFILFPWERVRGCPYACTFCDWSSGLHHKVNVLDLDWKEEIKFISKLKHVVLYSIDANVGILKDDVDVVKFALDNFNNSYHYFENSNNAKLHKDRVLELELYKARRAKTPKGKTSKVSLQHIDKEVLNNIDRPSISWEENKQFIKELKNAGQWIRAEVINGLPGATLEKNIHMLKEFSIVGVDELLTHPWVILPNSPAYNIDYRKKHNLSVMKYIKFSNTSYAFGKEIPLSDVDEVYSSIKNRDADLDIIDLNIIMDTNYIQDYFLFRNLSSLFNHYQRQMRNGYDLKSFSHYMDKHYHFLKLMSEQLVKQLQFYVEKYGFFVDIFRINNKLISYDYAVDEYLYKKDFGH